MEYIPSVDLSAFCNGGNIDEQQDAATKLGTAAAQHGFVVITGHGVPLHRLEEAFSYSRRLYALPSAEKTKGRRPDDPLHHRGYSAVNREKVARAEINLVKKEEEKARLLGVSDYKETYEIGSETNNDQSNVWLPDDVLPGFREFMTGFFWDLYKASSHVLEALIMALKLTPSEGESLRMQYQGEYSQMRLAHYLPVSETLAKNENTFRLAAHRDLNCFTMVFQDGENAGLEFKDPSTGGWVLAPPTSNVVVLNIADSMDRLSNGHFPSALHRVVTPLGPNGRLATNSRYSIMFFASPRHSETINPADSLVELDGKAVYNPITFGEYRAERFAVAQHAS